VEAIPAAADTTNFRFSQRLEARQFAGLFAFDSVPNPPLPPGAESLDTPAALRLLSFAGERTMRSLCRLSVASILLLCSAAASAQTAAQPAPPQTPTPFVVQISPPLSTNQAAPQLPAPSTTFLVPPLSSNTIHRLEADLNAQKLSLLAQNNGPCYALRTYGFTTGHEPAAVPHLSSQTTCTAASKTHLRELVKTPSSR
jgi:hypothetical protein